ncbi:PLDc N-terminal domain-containing protein [Microbacteriaceae bacterium VKM Ac-2854]|nr:PLDc N-terminal domain-containing protein [Microbacteriaceae bacterium VKM Ac-2854]
MPTDPIIPTAYDFLWWAIPIAAAILLVISIVTIIKARHLTAGARVGWTAIVVLFPIVGSAIWLLQYFTSQRHTRKLKPATTSP